jgi:hypothetical protein
LVTLKPRLPSRGFCCRPPLSFPSDSRFAATCLILPLLCPSRISDTPAVLRRTFSAVRPASRRRAISCSAAPGDQGKGVIAGYYATFWGALSVAMRSISFEEKGAGSGLLSLANPASHQACRSALNMTFRYSALILRPRCCDEIKPCRRLGRA